MGRPLRIEFPGALYHVTSRGNARAAVFLEERDFARRVDWLRRAVETYGWQVHAYALMTNHDHLFVETPQPNLASGMQYLNGSYTSYFNRRHRRVGHLFQGRYQAVLVENEGHYHEISRYVHLNPVRAGMVPRPEDWLWSSYPGYHWVRRRLRWVTYKRVLREFGRDEIAARRRYRSFVAAGVRQPLDSPFNQAVHDMLLGSGGFVDRVRRLLDRREDDPGVPALRRLRSRPSLDWIIDVVSTRLGADASAWMRGRRHDSMARSVAAYLARCRFGYSATVVADALGYAGPSSVAQAVRRIAPATDRLSRAMREMEKQLTND